MRRGSDRLRDAVDQARELGECRLYPVDGDIDADVVPIRGPAEVGEGGHDDRRPHRSDQAQPPILEADAFARRKALQYLSERT